MRDFLLILQTVFSISLIGLVMLQVKGTGFGRVWGGLSVSSSRRGLEGIVFKATFALTGVFILLSVVTLVV